MTYVENHPSLGLAEVVRLSFGSGELNILNAYTEKSSSSNFITAKFWTYVTVGVVTIVLYQYTATALLNVVSNW